MDKSNYRLFGSYRASLAMAVVVSHSFMFTPEPTSLAANIGLGNIAVMSFFVLSGFIISEAGTTFYRDRPLAFIVNRFWRIAPSYWLALAISIGLHCVLHITGALRFPDYVTPPIGIFEFKNIISNIFTIFPFQGRTGLVSTEGFYGFVRFYWAILAEVEFYLAAFITFCAMALLPRFRELIAGCAVGSILVLHLLNEYIVPVRAELSLAPYFLLGVCLYGWNAGSRMASWAVMPCYLAAVLHFLRYVQGKIPLEPALSGLTSPAVWIPTVIMAFMPLLVVVLSRANPSQVMSQIDRRLGEFSYPIYLNHFAVLIGYAALDLVPSWGVMVWAPVGSVAVSWLAMQLIEAPLKPLRNRIRGKAL